MAGSAGRHDYFFRLFFDGKAKGVDVSIAASGLFDAGSRQQSSQAFAIKSLAGGKGVASLVTRGQGVDRMG